MSILLVEAVLFYFELYQPPVAFRATRREINQSKLIYS
jgi:hypothetical protein